MKTSVATSSKRKKALKLLYFSLGAFFFVVAIIGIFLPVLPTAPFLLLTAYFWAKGSDKFHTWLLSHPHFGPPIKDWQRTHAIPLKTKIIATISMWIGLVFSGIVFTKLTYVRWILVGIGVTGTTALWLIKTRRTLT